MGGGLFRGAIGAIIGGLIGASIWAAITYFANAEIGWIAWGIGLLCGLGVRVMCSSEANVGLGVIAAGVAVLSIVAGKYAAIELLLAKEMGESPVTSITANDMIVSHADAVVGEWEAAGKEVAWPDGMTIEEAVQEADYDPAVWSEAKARWDAVDPAGQQQQIADRQRQQDEALDEFTNLIRVEAFKASFGALDVVFFLLAIATAFKVGSGMGQS